MVTRRTSKHQNPMERHQLLVSHEEARKKLEDRIEKGKDLKVNSSVSEELFEQLSKQYSKWDSFNSELLRGLFTTSEMKDEYDSFGSMFISLYEKTWNEKLKEFNSKIDDKNHRLASIIERLELISIASKNIEIPDSHSVSSVKTNKVFVVHDHDESSKTNLEIFLKEIGLTPVVLHRQADEGLTIIEKFEKHSEVDYAFILLTPDEISYLSSDKEINPNDRREEYRARPNVIFEFGYFIGKLGRSRVCCLYTGNVSLPSDVSGMIYKKYEKNIDEVAYGVIKDLKAAGYEISY